MVGTQTMAGAGLPSGSGLLLDYAWIVTEVYGRVFRVLLLDVSSTLVSMLVVIGWAHGNGLGVRR